MRVSYQTLYQKRSTGISKRTVTNQSLKHTWFGQICNGNFDE